MQRVQIVPGLPERQGPVLWLVLPGKQVSILSTRAHTYN